MDVQPRRGVELTCSHAHNPRPAGRRPPVKLRGENIEIARYLQGVRGDLRRGVQHVTQPNSKLALRDEGIVNLHSVKIPVVGQDVTDQVVRLREGVGGGILDIHCVAAPRNPNMRMGIGDFVPRIGSKRRWPRSKQGFLSLIAARTTKLVYAA